MMNDEEWKMRENRKEIVFKTHGSISQGFDKKAFGLWHDKMTKCFINVGKSRYLLIVCLT
jgi:hypothetical protein